MLKRNNSHPTRLCDRQNTVQLPLCWQFGMPKFTFQSPKSYINKCSTPVPFCQPFCYLDKCYSWSQRELSLNLQHVGLCSVSSNNLQNDIHFQNTSQALYPQDHLWMEKTENQKTECWPPAERKEGSDNTDIWDWNPGFITQRSLARSYAAASIKVCVTLDVQLQRGRCRTGTFLYGSGQTSVFRFNSEDKYIVPY